MSKDQDYLTKDTLAELISRFKEKGTFVDPDLTTQFLISLNGRRGFHDFLTTEEKTDVFIKVYIEHLESFEFPNRQTLVTFLHVINDYQKTLFLLKLTEVATFILGFSSLVLFLFMMDLNRHLDYPTQYLVERALLMSVDAVFAILTGLTFHEAFQEIPQQEEYRESLTLKTKAKYNVNKLHNQIQVICEKVLDLGFPISLLDLDKIVQVLHEYYHQQHLDQ